MGDLGDASSLWKAHKSTYVGLCKPMYYEGRTKITKATVISDLSHERRAQLATIHRDSITTSSTVPGQIVIRVLRTKRVLKLIRFSAPILRDDASVNSRLCNSITLHKNKLYDSISIITLFRSAKCQLILTKYQTSSHSRLC